MCPLLKLLLHTFFLLTLLPDYLASRYTLTKCVKHMRIFDIEFNTKFHDSKNKKRKMFQCILKKLVTSCSYLFQNSNVKLIYPLFPCMSMFIQGTRWPESFSNPAINLEVKRSLVTWMLMLIKFLSPWEQPITIWTPTVRKLRIMIRHSKKWPVIVHLIT